jgi:hypothetical protein
MSQDCQSEKELKLSDCPTPDEDFPYWLKHQKKNWRGIRKAIKSEKRIIPVNKGFSSAGGVQGQALANFMRNMDETVLNANWHIL